MNKFCNWASEIDSCYRYGEYVCMEESTMRVIDRFLKAVYERHPELIEELELLKNEIELKELCVK